MAIEFNTKVGLNRGNRRVWLEGKRLADNGWKWRGLYYQINDVENQRIVLLKADQELEELGKPKVIAGRNRGDKEIPIIDLCEAYVTKCLGEIDIAHIEMDDSIICITAG